MAQDLKRKLQIEWTKHWSESKKYREKFQNSFIYGLGLPSLVMGVSYLSKNTDVAEACRQVASWAYIAISPFIIINGMRYAKEKSLDSTLRDIVKEINYPDTTNLGEGE